MGRAGGVEHRREDGKGKNHVHLKEKIFKYLFPSLRRREVYLYPFCKIKCHNFKYMFTINVFKTLGTRLDRKLSGQNACCTNIGT